MNSRGPRREAEELLADRVAADIFTEQNIARTFAVHQRDIQKLWDLWCEGADVHSQKRAQQALGKQTKAQSGCGQVCCS